MTARTARLLIAAVLASGLLTGCPPPGGKASTGTDTAAASQAAPILRLAGVEEIEIVVLDTDPVQVRVAVYGWLPDSCTTIRNVEQTREANVIYLRIITTRPGGVMCAQMIKRFRKTFPVDTQDLPPGTYTLDVSGKTKEFALP